MNFTAAYSGFAQNRDKLNRQRRELAQAFQQFQASNPEATVQDFQAFIDTMAGGGLGSNYIRGGAPSQAILESLAEDGAARKRQRLLQQTSENFRRRAADLSTLEAMADKAVLGMNNEDFDGAYNDFVEALGPNGQQIVDGMNLRNRFSTQNRDLLVGRRLAEAMPAIQNYLSMNNFSLESVDPAQMSAFFGVPESQIEPFITAAERQVRMKMTEWWQTNNDRMQQRANTAALAGQDPEEAVLEYIRNTPMAENLIGEDGKLKDYDLSNFVEMSQRVVQEREEAQQLSAKGRVNDMIREWENNDRLEGYLRDGNNARALQHMFEIAGRTLADADFPRLYGKTKEEIAANPALAFQSDLDRYVGSERDVQDENYDARTIELDQKVAEASRNFVPSNQARLTEVFKNYFSDDVAGTLGRQLGQAYAYSPTLENSVFQIMSTLPEDIQQQAQEGAATAVDYILGQLQQRGLEPNVEETRERFIEQQREQFGLYQPQTFDDWLNGETDEINSTILGYRERLNQALVAFNKNPQLLASELMRQKAAIETFKAEVGAEMQARERSQRTWLYYNSGGWDQARVQQGIIGPVSDQVAELSTMIDQAIANANELAAASEDTPINTQTEVRPSSVDDLDQTGTAIGSAFKNMGFNAAASDQIRLAAGFATDGSLLGAPQAIIGKPVQIVSDLLQPEAERERRAAMRDYVEDAEAGLNEYGAVLLQNGFNDRFSEMIRDITTMTPEQFEAKYAAAINQLKQERTLSIDW